MHLPHQLSVPFVALSVVYAAAISIALANPGRPTLAGLVVLAGLTARWVAHHRHSPAPAPAAVAARPPDAAPARATPA